MNPNNRSIDELVFDCCRELFSAYQLDVRPRACVDFAAEEPLVMCGIMGFGGTTVRGALVLGTTNEPLERTNPGGFGSQRDWVGELANQLMGRVKNRLLSLGVEIHLATPTALSGDNLALAPGRSRDPQVFATDNGCVCVWIDCEFADGFELSLSPLPGAESAVSEGDAVLF